MRIKLTVAYDGTDFCGWALQARRRTVQGVLSDAILEACGQAVELVAASRTDSGAHARGQVCHFDSNVAIEPAKWPLILNRLLPDDLAVVRSTKVMEAFHSRFCGEDRWYRYRISEAPRNPLTARYVHDHGRTLDLGLMQVAGQLLVGRHDFRAYTEELDPMIENTTRKLRSVQIGRRNSEIWIDIVGTAFLRGMMRRMSGVLVEVGSGRRTVKDVADLLTKKRETMQLPVVLPAKGLCLMRVRYGNPLRDNRRNGDEG